MTPRTIITDALKMIGVVGSSQDLEHEEAADCLRQLNNILSTKATEGHPLHAKKLFDVPTIAASSNKYSIASSGADIALARPENITGVQTVSGDDVHELEQIPFTDWAAMSTQIGDPKYYAYRKDHPFGWLYFSSTMPASYYKTIRLLYDESFDALKLDEEILLPDQYWMPLTYSLSIAVYPMFDTKISGNAMQIIASMSAESWASVERNNFDCGNVDLGADTVHG